MVSLTAAAQLPESITRLAHDGKTEANNEFWAAMQASDSYPEHYKGSLRRQHKKQFNLQLCKAARGGSRLCGLRPIVILPEDRL